jgi:putative ABC transport system ATP-binding protein
MNIKKAASEVIFAADGLTKTYISGEVAVHALRGVNLEIARRGRGATGPFWQRQIHAPEHHGRLDHPTSGSILFKNAELTRFDDRALTAYRRHHVGFVFQFYNLIPSLTAYETSRW